MDMKDNIGKYEFMAEPFHCDFTKRLTMAHLGNCILNASDFDAASHGFGMSRLNPEDKTWVLSRLAVEVGEMPREYDGFYVETWIESAMKYFTCRNYRIFSSSRPEAVYGYARSVWALIDTATRRPQSLTEMGDIMAAACGKASPDCPIEQPSRVNMGKAQIISSLSMKPCYSDIDINGHVNSVKYIEHVLNLFSLDHHRLHPLRRLDIAYGAESHYGDTLTFSRACDDGGASLVRITKSDADGSASEEACRCRLIFR